MTQNKLHRLMPFLALAAFLMFSIGSDAQRSRRNRDRMPKDTTAVDSVALDSVGKKKQPLDAPVTYEASDSIVFTQGGFVHLFGDGKVNYEDIELTSAVITMNMDSSMVYAEGVKDSIGTETGTPVFKEGDTPYESKTMRYNFKSKKGFIHGIVTQQGEGYVTSQEAKKGAGDEFYIRNGKYTTCDHEHPHFYLKLTQAKVRPKKDVVFGPAQIGGGRCAVAYSRAFRFFPVQQQLFIGIHHAYFRG